jgi:hypothetical protein
MWDHEAQDCQFCYFRRQFLEAVFLASMREELRVRVVHIQIGKML